MKRPVSAPAECARQGASSSHRRSRCRAGARFRPPPVNRRTRPRARCRWGPRNGTGAPAPTYRNRPRSSPSPQAPDIPQHMAGAKADPRIVPRGLDEVDVREIDRPPAVGAEMDGPCQARRGRRRRPRRRAPRLRAARTVPGRGREPHGGGAPEASLVGAGVRGKAGRGAGHSRTEVGSSRRASIWRRSFGILVSTTSQTIS